MTHKYIGPTFFILSAQLDILPARDNIYRTIDLQNQLDDLGFKYRTSHGVWRGQSEASFLVFTDDYDTIKQLADSFNQEAFIRVNPNRSMDLCGPSQIYIGEWTEIPYKPSGNHTEVDGRYFQSVYFTSGVI